MSNYYSCAMKEHIDKDVIATHIFNDQIGLALEAENRAWTKRNTKLRIQFDRRLSLRLTDVCILSNYSYSYCLCS